jgi:hypothetical protein
MMRLKKSILLTLGLVLATSFAMAGALLAPVNITLQNKCTRPVKYEIRGGAATTGTIDAEGKSKLKLEPGQKVYVDGELCLEVTVKDEGTTFVVCR